MTENSKGLARAPAPERRRARRWVVTMGLMAEIEEGLSIRGHLFDVSLTGAYIVLDTRSAVGTKATLTFRLDVVLGDCRALGHVARFESLGQRVGIGIAFTEMNRSCRAFIHALDAQNDSQRVTSFQLVRSLALTLR